MPPVKSSTVLGDILLYWFISIVLFELMDRYAAAKLHKNSLAFKVLRMPKYLASALTSFISLAGVFVCFREFEISQQLETLIGVPYFALWFYYLWAVLARIRAERAKH